MENEDRKVKRDKVKSHASNCGGEDRADLAFCPACKVMQMNDRAMEVGWACSRIGAGASH